MKRIFIEIGLFSVLLAGCANHDRAARAYPYHNPLTSPGAKFGGLPPATQQTIRAQAGMAEIYDILKMTNADGVAYKVIFRDAELHPPLYVASDGSVLYPDLNVAVGAGGDTIGVITSGPVAGIKFGDLPVKVARTVQDKAPTAEVAYISKRNVAGKTYYEISFKDPQRNPKMFVAEDGALITRSPP